MKSSMDKNAAQISSKSDKVMYDRFDADFVAVCQEVELLEDTDSDVNTNTALREEHQHGCCIATF